MLAGQYAEWVKDPYVVDRSCCSLTGQTERLILAQPGHRADGVSTALVAQPTSAPEPHLHRCCLRSNPRFFSVQPRNRTASSLPKLTEKVCVLREQKTRTPWPGAGMKSPHTNSVQGQKRPLQLCHQGTSDHGCSESNDTKVMLQKVACVNCLCCYLLQLKTGVYQLLIVDR